jgi:hypothetical protein
VTSEPSVPGGGFGAVGHVVTSEPSSGRWRARCHGARGNARALWHRERFWSRWDTRWHRSPPLLSAESGTIGVDLSPVHKGTRSAGYRHLHPMGSRPLPGDNDGEVRRTYHLGRSGSVGDQRQSRWIWCQNRNGDGKANTLVSRGRG